MNSLFENREPTKSSGPAPLSGREVGPEEEPDWAQGLELSCNWGSVINVNIVEVNCELISQGELPAELEAVELTPQARGRSGAKWPGAKQVLTLVTESKFIFKFPLAEAFQKQLRLEIDNSAVVFYRSYDLDTLPGMSDELGLIACARGKNPISACFKRAGVEVPIFDEDQSTAELKSYCQNTDKPTHAICEIGFDGQFEGSNEEMKNWFVFGTKLVNEAGQVDTKQFCSSFGIVKKNSFSSIISMPIMYPWLQKDSIPCFQSFDPSDGNVHVDGKFIAIDTINGEDGEPYCYFALIKTEVLEDLSKFQLMVIKNPKFFEDAINKEFSPQAFEASAQYLQCAN